MINNYYCRFKDNMLHHSSLQWQPPSLFRTLTQTPPVTASFISLTASGRCHNHAPNACDHEFTQILHHTGTILEHICHTAQILISGNHRGFIHTNVESVQSTSTLLLLSQHVYENCELLFISFAFSTNKAVSHKCKPTILHFNSDRKMFIIHLNYLFHGIGCSRMLIAGYYYNYNQRQSQHHIIIRVVLKNYYHYYMKLLS